MVLRYRGAERRARRGGNDAPRPGRGKQWGGSARQPGAGAGRGQTDLRNGCWGQGMPSSQLMGTKVIPGLESFPLGFGFCVILRMELWTVSMSLICSHDGSRH